MRLATIDIAGRPTAAVIRADGSAVVLGATVAAAAGLSADDPALSGSLAALIAGGPAALASARKAADSVAGGVPGETVRLLAPLPRPGKNVFCVGRNYAEHIAEGERAQNVTIGVTEVPVFFTKPPTAVIGPGAPVPLMIWKIPEIIARISQQHALAAGDVIMTGTPAGVGAVVSGDRLVGEIDRLGGLEVVIGPRAA